MEMDKIDVMYLLACKQSSAKEMMRYAHLSRVSMQKSLATKDVSDSLECAVLSIEGSSVFLGQSQLELASQGLMLRLFRLFAVARDGRCGLREILACVYQMPPGDTNSKRFNRSARVRAVKLLSRARCLARQHLCPDHDLSLIHI